MNANSPGSSPVDEHPEISAANARAGLVLFFVYLAFYGGFVGLAAFAPQSMGRPAIAEVNLAVTRGVARRLFAVGNLFSGVNLAITYGLALILGALVIAA